jgi:hypothetical protein
MIDASIIIVTYNTKDFTQRCLMSIYENVKDISIEVICVDNNSKDGTSTMIKNNFPEVILIENQENLGYARANNLGIDRSSGRYVLLLIIGTATNGGSLSKLSYFGCS